MESSELKQQVQRTIDDLGSLGDIKSSDGWNESLLKRLNSSRTQNSHKGLFVISLCLIAGINLILGISMISRSNVPVYSVKNSMEQLSAALLINPISAKE